MSHNERPHVTDEDTYIRIDRSKTPKDVDGYKLEEPKRIACPACGADAWLTRDPGDPGIADLHDEDSDCPYADMTWRSG